VCHEKTSPMTPTLENIQLFVAVSFGLAIVLSGLLFIIQKISGRKIKWGGFIVFALAAYGLPIVGFASKYVGDRKTWRREATTSGIVVEHDLPTTTNIGLSMRYPVSSTIAGTKERLLVTLARFTLGRRSWFTTTRYTLRKPTFAAFGEP